MSLTLLTGILLLTDAPRVLVAVDVTRVKDADTVVADVTLPFPPGLVLHDQDVRLQGFDAWETSRRRTAVRVTDAEIRKGKAATAALEALVAESERCYLAPVEHSQFTYGRLEGYLILYDADTDRVTEVADWARENGHCRE